MGENKHNPSTVKRNIIVRQIFRKQENDQTDLYSGENVCTDQRT